MTGEDRGESRTDAIVRTIRQRIERRILTPGARLPSVRAMAASSGVSKSTVVEAYERLVADGMILSRQGSGFFVATPLAPLSLERMGPIVAREIDPLWMLRQSLTASVDALRPGCGWLPGDWMAEESIRRGLRQIARTGQVTGYAEPAGPESLRRLIARRLAAQGLEAGPDQILITDSGTHAVDLILRFLVEPGDTVLIDDPCYFNFLALLRAHRVTLVGVPMTPHGPDPAAFAQAIAAHRPRVYLTNSGIHNPTGASLSAPVAHQILTLAEAHDLIIIEDDIFADFEHKPAPRLATFDGLDRVIRVSSFSKSLSSAVRCGHIAARPDWIAGLTDLRIATGMSGSGLGADLVHAALTDGTFRRHMERTRDRLSGAMERTIAALRGIGLSPWIAPEAGLFVWCRLPGTIEAITVARIGIEQGIVFAPGNVFSLSQSAGQYLRFNAAMSSEPRLLHFLERICAGNVTTHVDRPALVPLESTLIQDRQSAPAL